MKEKNSHEHSPAKILTLDQRRFDVMNQRGNNVGPTLKMKQNLTSDWYNFISTLFQRGLNIIKNNIKTSRPSDKYGFADR